MVLAHLCKAAGVDFVLAHCNFQLRGEESAEDERFIGKLAEELNVNYYVKYFETEVYAKEYKLSIQVAARDLRYAWFKELIAELGLNYTLTAHQADDVLETFLINLSRGTGIQGLTGIPARTNDVLRPLLPFSRDQILKFAESNGISWREDSSNQEKYYLRNKIRHDIVPELKKLHPTFLENFKATQSHLSGSVQILEQHISAIKKEIFKKSEDGWEIATEELLRLQPLKSYLHALFREYGFTEWENVLDLLDAMSGKEIRSATHRLIKDREVLLLAPLAAEIESSFEFTIDTQLVEGPEPMKIEEVDSISQLSRQILYVDKETLNHRLELRKWKKGDYFYPLGMKGRKLVSKYFKDEKFTALEKEGQWLLYSGDQLVWIIGKRADERFKVTPDTKSILRFRLIG